MSPDEALRAWLLPGPALPCADAGLINRTYLASLMGLPPDQARQVVLDNCGISVVVCEGEKAAQSLIDRAHETCPYSKLTRSGIEASVALAVAA